MLLHFLPKKNK